MNFRAFLYLIALLVLAAYLQAQGPKCDCDPARPETMKQRQCSLCAEAEKRTQGEEFFVLKDINPRKPNRWLVLPRAHGSADHPMHELPRNEQIRLWKFAVEAAEEKFPGEWGLAYNGSKVRTQCHLHIHFGRFIRAAENSKFRLVKRIEDFPAPLEGGVFIHKVPGGYHVHTGEEIMETALVR